MPLSLLLEGGGFRDSVGRRRESQGRAADDEARLNGYTVYHSARSCE